MEPKNRTILVVDDDDAMRTLVCILLRMAGYSVLEARDGMEALELVGQEGPTIALLLTDVYMPKLGGPEMADKVLQVRPDLPVLFMSANSPTATRGYGCLSKPFTSQELLHRIQEALGNRRKMNDRHGGLGQKACPE